RLLATVAQQLPVAVDLRLVGAGDLERDRLVEGELGSAVDPDERLAVQVELDGEDAPRGPRPGVGGADDPRDPGVREHRDAELGSLERLAVEPEVGHDPWHVVSSGSGRTCSV